MQLKISFRDDLFTSSEGPALLNLSQEKFMQPIIIFLILQLKTSELMQISSADLSKLVLGLILQHDLVFQVYKHKCFLLCVISWPKKKRKIVKGNQLMKLTRLNGGLSGLVWSVDLFCFWWQPVALSFWAEIYWSLGLLPPGASQAAWSLLPPQQGQKSP